MFLEMRMFDGSFGGGVELQIFAANTSHGKE
jgi:hypothetical protein